MSQLALFPRATPPNVAVFSPCGLFRYLLTREFGGTRTVVFVLLNPSTATAEKPDPTLSRCIAFAQAWGFGRLVILNLCAYRETKPALMFARARAGLDIIGPNNDATIEAEVSKADLVVAGWGTNAGKKVLRERARLVRHLLRRASKNPVVALRHTKDGHPEHPLYVPGIVTPEPLRWPGD